MRITARARARSVSLVASLAVSAVFATLAGSSAAVADDGATTSTPTPTAVVTGSPTAPTAQTDTTAPATTGSAVPAAGPAQAAASSIATPGTSSLTVKDVQIRLKLRKYWAYGIDGYYGTTLTAVLKTFQTDAKLPVTGLLTQETFERIVARTATPLVVPVGSTSFAAKDAQIRLGLLGLWSWGIDGYSGSTLANRLLAFQQTYNLPYSGALDERTVGQLAARTASPVLVAPGTASLTAKNVQIRLKLLGLWSWGVDGYSGSTLSSRLLAFQQVNNLPYSATIDQRTFGALIARTASPEIATKGTFNATAKDVQYRLQQLGLWSWAIDGYYGSTLMNRLLAFQQVNALPYSGTIDRRTYDALAAKTRAMPAPNTFDAARFSAGLAPVLPNILQLDSRCRVGRVMCINKTTRTLTWVVNGVPVKAMWARFGGPGNETREGTFSVFKRYEYVISNLYFTPMPYSMFFSGGQAVHYSSNFARLGYAGASHGCVNIADYEGVAWLFWQSRIGDKVVVYH